MMWPSSGSSSGFLKIKRSDHSDALGSKLQGRKVYRTQADDCRTLTLIHLMRAPLLSPLTHSGGMISVRGNKQSTFIKVRSKSRV